MNLFYFIYVKNLRENLRMCCHCIIPRLWCICPRNFSNNAEFALVSYLLQIDDVILIVLLFKEISSQWKENKNAKRIFHL